MAKSAGATPFKRPENGVFQPGSNWQRFFFAETGDTNADAGDNPNAQSRGAYGSIYRLDMAPDLNSGTIRTIVRGEADHNSFDNVSFLDENTLLAAEDRGEMLHTQKNTLDSLWSFDVGSSDPLGTSLRLLAQRRDKSATGDRAFVFPTRAAGFQNDGDNEVTGVHTSLGLTSVAGLQGVPLTGPARTFYTAQHGDNPTYELRAKE